jgi:hypothetical protein
MDKEKFELFIKRQQFKLQDAGFMVDSPRAFASLSRVIDVGYDSSHNSYYKVYS